jgi:hypothetical protein
MTKHRRQWLTEHGASTLAQLRRALREQTYTLPRRQTDTVLTALDWVANYLPTLSNRNTDSPIADRKDMDCLHHLRTAANILRQPNLNAALAKL